MLNYNDVMAIQIALIRAELDGAVELDTVYSISNLADISRDSDCNSVSMSAVYCRLPMSEYRMVFVLLKYGIQLDRIHKFTDWVMA